MLTNSNKTLSHKLFVYFCFFFTVLTSVISFSCKLDDFDKVRDVIIVYYYNDKDNEFKVVLDNGEEITIGHVKSRSICKTVSKGSLLEGSPITWTDDWEIAKDQDGNEIGYGFVGDGTIGDLGVPYRYNSDGEVWKFVTINGINWDTSQPINNSISIKPFYSTEEEDVLADGIKLYFKYNMPDKDSPTSFVEVVEPRVLPLTRVNANLVYLKYCDGQDPDTGSDNTLKILKDGYDDGQDGKDVFHLGYMDGFDHNKYYSYQKNDDEKKTRTYIHYNKNGELIGEVNSEDPVRAAMDGSVFVPKYVSVGFKNIEASDTADSALPDVEQVFIPGNVDKEGNIHPFPYTVPREGSFAKYALDANQYDSPSAAFQDLDQKNLVIPNMYVFDTVCPSSLIKAIPTDISKNYKFRADISDSNGNFNENEGMPLKYYYLRKINYIEMCAFANMVTDYYNSLHPSKPLRHVYYYQFSGERGPSFSPVPYNDYSYASILKDSTKHYVPSTYTVDPNSASASSTNFILIDETADGFRLPYEPEFEYIQRIITDSRQIPDRTTKPCQFPENSTKTYYPVIEPTSDNNYLYYFESAQGAPKASSYDGDYYCGSGAGLALYDEQAQQYDKTKLRTYALACGRENNEQAWDDSVEDKKLPDDDTVMKSSYDKAFNPSKNRKNGAGVYGMSAVFVQPTNTLRSDNSHNQDPQVIYRGGRYSDDGKSQKIGYRTSHSLKAIHTCSALRLVRSVF